MSARPPRNNTAPSTTRTGSKDTGPPVGGRFPPYWYWAAVADCAKATDANPKIITAVEVSTSNILFNKHLLKSGVP